MVKRIIRSKEFPTRPRYNTKLRDDNVKKRARTAKANPHKATVHSRKTTPLHAMKRTRRGL
jgi:hypothetical protein